MNVIFIRQILANCGEKLAVNISGTSMEPCLSDGEKYLVKKDTIRPGKIIIFEKDGRLIAHRVVKIRQRQIMCKGDNAYTFEMVSADRVIGSLVKREKTDDWKDIVSARLSYFMGKIAKAVCKDGDYASLNEKPFFKAYRIALDYIWH